MPSNTHNQRTIYHDQIQVVTTTSSKQSNVYIKPKRKIQPATQHNSKHQMKVPINSIKPNSKTSPHHKMLQWSPPSSTISIQTQIPRQGYMFSLWSARNKGAPHTMHPSYKTTMEKMICQQTQNQTNSNEYKWSTCGCCWQLCHWMNGYRNNKFNQIQLQRAITTQ